MKIDVKEAKVTTNLSQENVTAMSISVDGMEHIMTLLTNLYKDPELAVIREYYTNAVDAHVEAGVQRAVEITLPSWDDPIYKVQDFGVGMSKDDIVNIYAQYGASTKRNTNDQVGAFGLGCKSALTITQQFTLVSVKNGMKTTALIAKSESGVNTVNIVNTVETADGNGTTVKIPVSSNSWGFNKKANKFFAFSPKGAVLVDGKAPESAFKDAQKIINPSKPDMEVFLRPKEDAESYVIMGSVPYALSHAEIELSLNRLNAKTSRGFVRMPKYFPVPIGSVDLTPSREGIRFTEKTNSVIDAYISFVVNDLREIAQKEIDEATTLEDFWEIYNRWNEMVNLPKKLKGEEVPTELKLDAPQRTITRLSYGTAAHSESDFLSLYSKEQIIIVSGYSADKYKKINGYITPYMEEKGLDDATFCITDAQNLHTDKWVKMKTTFTYVSGDDIIAIGREKRKRDRQAISKTNGTAQRSKIKYPVMFLDDEEVRWVDHDEIAENTPYLHQKGLFGESSEFIKRQYRSGGYTRDILSEIVEYFELLTSEREIILLNNSRTVKALEQRVKGTYSLNSEVEKLCPAVKSLITDEVTTHHALERSSWKNFLTNYRIEKHIKSVLDPEVVAVVSPPKDRIEAYEKFNTTRDAAKFFSYEGMPAIPSINLGYHTIEQVTEALDKKYPLVKVVNIFAMDTSHAKHLVKYFNMVHAEELVKS